MVWLITLGVWTQAEQIGLIGVCKPPLTEKGKEVRSRYALEKDALRQVDIWLARKRNSGFVECGVESYRIHFACAYANVHEYDWGKVVTEQEWKSRNSLPRFQTSLLRLVNCWCQPFQNSQVEFSAEILFYLPLNAKKTSFCSLTSS